MILGCGRSGTSCLAGMIATDAYNIGGVGYKGNETNPKGFFETYEVNNINDTILLQDYRTIFTSGSKHGWLSQFPLGVSPYELNDTAHRIERVIDKKPFCIKDPRFSYTLPIWQRYILDTKYICVFRHPGAVVNSIIKNCNSASYLSKVKINRIICYNIWKNMYTNILRLSQGGWLFIHYDQILRSEKFDEIKELLECNLNKYFVDHNLCRSKKIKDFGKDIFDIYVQLCSLAEYRIEDDDV